METLQDYVLVSQSEILVEVYSRQADGWIYTRYSAGETVELPSVDLHLPMTVVYEDISLRNFSS